MLLILSVFIIIKMAYGMLSTSQSIRFILCVDPCESCSLVLKPPPLLHLVLQGGYSWLMNKGCIVKTVSIKCAMFEPGCVRQHDVWDRHHVWGRHHVWDRHSYSLLYSLYMMCETDIITLSCTTCTWCVRQTFWLSLLYNLGDSAYNKWPQLNPA